MQLTVDPCRNTEYEYIQDRRSANEENDSNNDSNAPSTWTLPIKCTEGGGGVNSRVLRGKA